MLVGRVPRRLSRRIRGDSVATAAPEAPLNEGNYSDSPAEQGDTTDNAGISPTTSSDSPKDRSRRAGEEIDSFTRYLAAIGKIPLLTPAGERALSRDMQLAREAMTGAVARVPAAVKQFLDTYASARNNQWELGHVVIPPPESAEQGMEIASQGADLSASPNERKSSISSLLQALTARYASWSTHPGPSTEKLALQREMARTFTALPVAPRMLRALCDTCHAFNERRTTIEHRLMTAVGIAEDQRDNSPLFTSASLSKWLLEPRLAHCRDFIRAIERDLRGLEAATGTDVTSLYQAHTDAKAARRRYQRAWSYLVEANLRLVITIARHFVRDGIALPDLVQEGNLGLFRASEKFDYRLGYRFSTYASFWIRQAVSGALPKQGRLITVPRYMYEHMSRLRSLRADLQQELDRDPSIEELTGAASLPPDTVFTALGADRAVLSLDTYVNEDEAAGLHDRLPDQHQPDPSDSVNDFQITERVADLLKKLPEREALILRLHFGLGGSRPITLEQIASILGITRERVRQLEVHALKTLRTIEAIELLESLNDRPGPM